MNFKALQIGNTILNNRTRNLIKPSTNQNYSILKTNKNSLNNISLNNKKNHNKGQIQKMQKAIFRIGCLKYWKTPNLKKNNK